jgi:hypothetical protein
LLRNAQRSRLRNALSPPNDVTLERSIADEAPAGRNSLVIDLS